MAAGPKLLQQEVPPQKPKCFEPKPGLGTEFQAALVKTAQTARAAVESGSRMPRAEVELPEGWERIAGLGTAGVAWRTRAAGPGKPGWAAPQPRCARRERAAAAGAGGSAAATAWGWRQPPGELPARAAEPPAPGSWPGTG